MKLSLTPQELRELVQPQSVVVKPFVEREHIGWLVTDNNGVTGEGMFVPLAQNLQQIIGRLHSDGATGVEFFEVFK